MCSKACVEKIKNLSLNTGQILFEDLISKLAINVLDSSKNSFEEILNNLSIEIKKKVLKKFLTEELNFEHIIPEIIKNQIEFKQINSNTEKHENQHNENESNQTLNENIKKLNCTNDLDKNKINQKASKNSQTCNLMKHLLNFLNENCFENTNGKKKRKRKRKRKKPKQIEINHKIENTSDYLNKTLNETKKNEVNNGVKNKNEIKVINILEEQSPDCQTQPNVKFYTTLSNQNESNFQKFSKCLSKIRDEKKINKDNLNKKNDTKVQKHNKKSLHETINQKSFSTQNNKSFEFSNEQNFEKIRKNDFLNNSKRVKREKSPSFKERRRITSARKPPTIYKRFKSNNSSSTSSSYSTSSCSSSCTNCSNKILSNKSSLTNSSSNKKNDKLNLKKI